MLFSAAGFLGVLALGILSLLFPLLSRFENTLGMLLKNTVLLGIAYLPRTLAWVSSMERQSSVARFVFPRFSCPRCGADFQPVCGAIFKPFMRRKLPQKLGNKLFQRLREGTVSAGQVHEFTGIKPAANGPGIQGRLHLIIHTAPSCPPAAGDFSTQSWPMVAATELVTFPSPMGGGRSPEYWGFPAQSPVLFACCQPGHAETRYRQRWRRKDPWYRSCPA